MDEGRYRKSARERLRAGRDGEGDGRVYLLEYALGSPGTTPAAQRDEITQTDSVIDSGLADYLTHHGGTLDADLAI